MNTYVYAVTNMQRDLASGIVVAAEFTVTASNGTASFTTNNQTAFPYPKADPTPYDELTEADVIVWIKELVGPQSEEQADAELAAYIERSANVIENGTPW
jgi:peptidoglycan hydrolase-like amidase